MATKLPKQLYRRGQQGTLVYSPDIAVFVKLSNDEILDLSPYIVDFNLGRVVNDISSFSCSIDNKFGQFDRVIKRMDRITVFLKRISWLQVFSGYVTTVPWQTVVPGNVTIAAQCTIKRLAHNYIDINSTEGMELLPWRNPRSFEEADGGAASTIVRLLTKVAKWPDQNISIQQIPEEWANDAAKVINGLLQEKDVEMAGQEFIDELKDIKNSLKALIDSLGWTGALDGKVLDDLNNKWADASAGTPGTYDEKAWRELVGMRTPNEFNAKAGVGGGLSSENPQYLFTVKAAGLEVFGNHKPGKGDAQKTFSIYLRLDAADSLAALVAAWIKSGKREVEKLEDHINIPVTAAFLSYDEQESYINSTNGGCLTGTKSEVNSTPTDSERFKDVFDSFTIAKDLGAKRNRSESEEGRFNRAEQALINSEMARLGIRISDKPRPDSDLPDAPYLDTQVTSPIAPGSGTYYVWKNEEVFWLSYPDFKFYKFDSSGNRYELARTGERVDVTQSAINVEGAIKLKCPAGSSIFGWATAICIKPGTVFYEQFAKNKLADYGWQRVFGESQDPVWKFVGNDKYPVYWDVNGRIDLTGRIVTPEDYNSETYTGAYTNLQGSLPEKMESDGIKALFSVLWMGMQAPQLESELATGERSWINDSSLLEVIKNICPASVRDFMSAPNGDFIAFVPDRIGKYSNFPSIQIRDIELLDFKAIASDNNLVTHYMSYADIEAAPLETVNTALQLFVSSAMLTVEQAPLMNFLLGRPINKVDKEYGPKILKVFGLRPKVEDNKFIRNRGFNFIYSVHKFQEMWANQWQFVVNLTFMPELYPGMRIELVDRTLPDGTPAPVAVYVESVSHSGSRATGFTTTAIVSTPMIKLNGKWTQYRPEFGPEDMPDSMEDVIETYKYGSKIKSLQQRGILDADKLI